MQNFNSDKISVSKLPSIGQLFLFYTVAMKNFIKAFMSFNRTERMGLIGLLILLALLIAVRTTMHLWVKPSFDEAKQQQLVAAWQNFKEKDTSARNMPIHDAASAPAIPRPQSNAVAKEQSGAVQQSHLFRFDPNTLDSAGFRRLGLREKTTAILLHWRAKGKHFYKKEELKKVYTLTPKEYDMLEPYISIAP